MKVNRWDWLVEKLPRVAALIAQAKAEHGAAWVAQCWRCGVVEGKPGWFWASEGALSVGTLWEDARIMAMMRGEAGPGASLLVLRPKEGGDGQAA